MLDARQHALLIAGFAGLSAAGAGWLIFGSTSLDRRLAPLQEAAHQLEAFRIPAPESAASAVLAARSAPIFSRPANTTGPSSLRLEGISVRPGGGSALIAIGGAPAKWLRQGESSGQLTLVGVSSGSVTLETPDGRTTLSLGQTSDAAATGQSQADVARMDEIPAGVRMPPPPASAARP